MPSGLFLPLRDAVDQVLKLEGDPLLVPFPDRVDVPTQQSTKFVSLQRVDDMELRASPKPLHGPRSHGPLQVVRDNQDPSMFLNGLVE